MVFEVFPTSLNAVCVAAYFGAAPSSAFHGGHVVAGNIVGGFDLHAVGLVATEVFVSRQHPCIYQPTRRMVRRSF